jgi:hypothetical protein
MVILRTTCLCPKCFEIDVVNKISIRVYNHLRLVDGLEGLGNKIGVSNGFAFAPERGAALRRTETVGIRLETFEENLGRDTLQRT